MTSISKASGQNKASPVILTSAKDTQAAISALRKAFNPTSNLDQDLFKQLDANGDGVLTKSELETAVTAAGSTKQAADALYAQLDPKKTGGISEKQFIARFSLSKNSKDAGAMTDLAKTMNPSTQLLQNLFSKLDANSDGALTKAELETAVTGSGGTKADADALYAQLDPNNTGSITLQQLALNLKPGQKAVFITSLTV